MMIEHDHERSAAGILRFCLSVVSCLYCVLLFFFLPLFFHDKYFDIGVSKYRFFFCITTGMLAVTALLTAAYIAVRLKNKETDPVLIIERIKDISMVDKAALIYLLACFISYFLSPYNTWAIGFKNVENPPLTGRTGWSMGLISQVLFVGIYFTISRFSDRAFRKIIMGALFAGSLISSILAILNRFSVDPLGFYAGISPYYRILFLSTLGQATWYSSYLSTVFPVGLAMFIYERRSHYRGFYVLYIIVSSMSLVTQNSDSAYIALCAALLVLFAFALDSNNYFTRYFQLIILILLSFRLAGLLQLAFPDSAVLPDRLSLFFSKSTAALVVTVILIILYIAYSVFQMTHDIVIRRVRIIRTAVLMLAMIAVVFLASVLILSAYGIYVPFLKSDYFIFNDNWGNGRGFTWRITMEMFAKLPLTNKLFGVGPDCYANYAYEFRSAQMRAVWGDKVLANAHNEWLNTLFTLGIFGFLSYAGFFAVSFVSFINKKRAYALSIAAAAVIAAYVGHNFFCYQQVLCTPFVFAIIGLCTAIEKSFRRRKGAYRRAGTGTEKTPGKKHML